MPPTHTHTLSGAPLERKPRLDGLAAKVDTLASEFAEIKGLLLNLQPGNECRLPSLEPHPSRMG